MSTSVPSPRSELHKIAKDAFLHALKSVAPEQLIKAAVRLDDSQTKLIIEAQVGSGHAEFDLTKTPNILVLGAGKATQELVSGILQVLSECNVENLKIHVQANFPKGQNRHHGLPSLPCATVSLLEASHPISDECTVNATNEQMKRIYESDPNTLAIVLLSGGGSALYETTQVYGSQSSSPITLQDLQAANKVLIESGANITEINTVRKHFSQVKGGRTAQHAIQSGRIKAVVGLYLSDVVGNDLSSVASGPTCPDITTFADCHAILSKYNIHDKMPAAIRKHLDEAKIETPKPGDPLFDGKVFNFLIGSADTSAKATESFLPPIGFHTVIFSNKLDGEASAYGATMPTFIQQRSHITQGTRYAFIATGEFTVTLKGKGVGGRNQEMLLSFLHELVKTENSLTTDVDFAVLSCAFDGIEGNSPATGAIVDSTSIERLRQNALFTSKDLKLELKSRLDNNDSFPVFQALEDAVITGYTGTNVNDLTVILLQKRSAPTQL
jgi:glycerate-2-kinase